MQKLWVLFAKNIFIETHAYDLNKLKFYINVQDEPIKIKVQANILF